jgi:hypothetical protein
MVLYSAYELLPLVGRPILPPNKRKQKNKNLTSRGRKHVLRTRGAQVKRSAEL